MKQLAVPALICATLLCGLGQTGAHAYDLKGDTLVATDALGRALPGYKECGPLDPEKHVIITYEPWFDDSVSAGMGANRGGPFNTTQILAANPANPKWGGLYEFHYWDQPELGYYLSKDTWVIRKHMELLMLAGVDIIAIDITNNETYASTVRVLLETLDQIRKEGGNPPKVVFFLNTNHVRRVGEVYEEFFKSGKYSKNWFIYQGKPLILCPSDGVDAKVKAYFTFRRTWSFNNAAERMNLPTAEKERLPAADQWSFIEWFPQPYGWHVPGVPEEMPVSPAAQLNYVSTITARGRSFHDGVEPPPEQRDFKGHNFADQWQRVLQVNPKFVYVSAWNEWIGQRLEDNKEPIPNEWMWTRKLRFPGDKGNSLFVDSYSEEFSRDIEPQKGGHGDLYYYQLASYIRRFKGVRKPEAASSPKTIKMKGDFSDWSSVRPEYNSMVGAALHRDHDGWGFVDADPKKPRLHYTNTTGRNEFNVLKVATDSQYIYFYAQTRQPITSYNDPNWMMLYIDSDCKHSTGWKGYDYLINCPALNASTTTVKKNLGGGWQWQTVGKVTYRVLGNKMEIRIPKSLLGYKNTGKMAFNFHWVDNIQKLGDIKEFGINGNSAPARVFNYHYER